jgi:glycosyltransferase involved in cell wall biosynthesis
VDDVFAPAASESSTAAEATGWEIPSDFILYIGRFQMRKNLERLLEAYSLLRNRFGPELKLVLAGKDMWHQQRIVEKIQTLGIEKDVICPGYVSDRILETLYRKARVFAFPSIHEGFGIPPLEAMARGVPVMACDRSAMPEILGDAAVYADPYDVGEMTRALEQLLSDEELRQRMIQRGKERVKRYSWQTAAHETLDVYRATLAK